ncbi:MAG: FGGY-family carbohydrate kinase [Rhodoglobus sp.]
MSSPPYLIGLDGGTEGLRVGIFDAAGEPLVFVRTAYDTHFVRPGWAEQNPQDWWDAAVSGIRKAMHKIGARGDDIASITVGATSCSLVCLDKSGVPLRPAIIWMDVRAAEEAREIAGSGSPSLQLSGARHASAEWLPSKALWLSRHQPEIYERTAWLAEYADYLTWRLSGERVASQNTAAIRAYYDVENGGWARELYRTLGLDSLIEKLPDTVLAMGTRVGTLSASAQEELNLPASVSVVTGGADAFVAQVGLGVVNPGALALITGSSHLAILQSSSRVHGEGTFGSYPGAVVDGQYTVEGGQTSSGSMLGWFRRLLDDGEYSARFFDSLTPLAQQLPPGADGVLVLDHFQGNRTPYVDAQSRGVIAGLSLSHRKEHIFRAMIESVCFGTENTLRRFRQQGHLIDRIVACGGAVNSEFWLQTHADVSGCAIEVTRVAEAATLGAAVLGAVGANIYANLDEATSAMVHADHIVEPDLERHDQYEPFFQAYTQTYEALTPVLHFLAAQQGSLAEESSDD